MLSSKRLLLMGGGAIPPLVTLQNLIGQSSSAGLWMPSVRSSLWQSSDGTTAVTADGDRVGRMSDLSPANNGRHLIQATDANRATFKEQGGQRYLDINRTASQVLSVSGQDLWNYVHSGAGCTVGVVLRVDTDVNFSIGTATASANVGWSFTRLSGGQFRFTVVNGSGSPVFALADGSLSLSTWTRAIITYSSAASPKARIFREGVMVAQTSMESSAPSTSNANNSLTVNFAGSAVFGIGTFFITDRVFSDSEITRADQALERSRYFFQS